MEERLQKILSRAGIASRRAAEQIMSEGRVTVNGETVRELGTKADIGRDDVRVDGVRVRAPERPVYLLLNKPKGIVTTRKDPEGRPTVMDLVPSVPGLFPVGRLDVTTEGAILLTNDGAFAERVAHPRYEVARVYHAKVRGIPDRETLAKMKRGVVVEGDRLTVDHARVIEADNNTWLEVTLHEGKHHEVRRLLEAVGHPVSKLRRVAIGPLTIKGLQPGQFRTLTPHEIQALRHGGAAVRPKRERPRIAHPGRRPGTRPPRTDDTRTENTKPAPARADHARGDHTRADHARKDAPRKDAPRTEAARTDVPRTEAARTDAARRGRPRSGKAGFGRTRSTGTRSGSARFDESGTDGRRTDNTRTDNARTDNTRTDATRTDNVRTDTRRTTHTRGGFKRSGHTGPRNPRSGHARTGRK
jgi:23S rRNA pseudouridine2605 synthase